jgi:hypothetical protein
MTDILDSLQQRTRRFSFPGLDFHFTDEIDIQFFLRNYYRLYLEAFHTAHLRIHLSLNHDINCFAPGTQDKKCIVIFTTDEKLIREIVHAKKITWLPEERYQKGFSSVWGYTYVVYKHYDYFKNYIYHPEITNAISHEFCHVLLTQYLNTPFDRWQIYRDKYIDEGIMMYLNNQYISSDNIRDEAAASSLDLIKVNIQYMKKYGLHDPDLRPASQNYSYQYSAGIVETLDRNIFLAQGEKGIFIPSRPVLSFIHDNIRKGKTFEEDLENQLGISIRSVEKEFRAIMGLP